MTEEPSAEAMEIAASLAFGKAAATWAHNCDGLEKILATGNALRDAAVRRAVEAERERIRRAVMVMDYPNDNPNERRLDDVIATINGKAAAHD